MPSPPSVTRVKVDRKHAGRTLAVFCEDVCRRAVYLGRVDGLVISGVVRLSCGLPLQLHLCPHSPSVSSETRGRTQRNSIRTSTVCMSARLISSASRRQAKLGTKTSYALGVTVPLGSVLTGVNESGFWHFRVRQQGAPHYWNLSTQSLT